MHQVAPGVWQLAGFATRWINVFVIGDVLIDAATRWAGSRITRQIGNRRISLLALTHCHPDHQGAAKFICQNYDVPLACHEADVAVMEGRAPMRPRTRLNRLIQSAWAGPPHPVSQVLHHGDEVGGFRVVHAPGHTSGHVIYFRDSDRVAIAGDLLHNISMLTGLTGLHETPWVFSVDPMQNRESVRLLLELEPRIIFFSHGPPLRRLEQLEVFVQRWDRSRRVRHASAIG